MSIGATTQLSFVLTLFLATNAPAQTPGSGMVTVTMLQTADSSRPATSQFNARVKTPVTIGNLTVPAGSSAVVRMVQVGAGNWTLSLVSVTANGQAVAVSGSSPELAGAAGLANTGSSLQSTVSGILKGLPGRKAQPANQNTSGGATAPAVSGARVYVPTGADVQFTLAGAVSAAATPRGTAQPAVAGTPAAQPPAAAQTAVVQPGIQPGAAAVSAPAAASTPAAPTANAVVYENIQYQLQSCQREAPHIICQIQITNLGTSDARLGGGQQTYYFDQAGNRQGVTMRSIANCVGFGACDLLPGIATAGRFEFVDQDGRAGTLVRLQIWQNNKAVAQFNNVQVQ